jgi:hypothetical protein
MAWKHISGWVQVTEPNRPEGPTDPGWGVEAPVDPGYGRPGGGWSPVDPGYGRPIGGHPDQGLPGGGGGHVWGALIRWLLRPHIDNDPSKPPARPVLPPSVDNGLPPGGGKPPHVWWGGGGHWEPIDPGYGKPPLWGFILGPDNGLPTPPVGPDQGLPGAPPTPDQGLPGQGGQWVPTDPDYGKPVGPCGGGGKPKPPLWAWIPDAPIIDNTLPPTPAPK